MKIETYARSRWQDWTGQKPRRLHIALLPALRHRYARATALIGDGFKPPSVVAKIAVSPDAREQVVREYRSLQEAMTALPAPYAEDLPAPLELVQTPEMAVLFVRALPGRKPVVPSLLRPTDSLGRRSIARLIDGTLQWSRELAGATQRIIPSSDPVLRYLERYPQQQGAERLLNQVSDQRAWQHGDPAPGNVLRKERIRMVDWEHASGDKLPWFDLAYFVLVMALLAGHQERLTPVEAFEGLYAEGSWCGVLIRDRVVASWDHPIGIGTATAITCMELSLNRNDNNDAWRALSRQLLKGEVPEWLKN